MKKFVLVALGCSMIKDQCVNSPREIKSVCRRRRGCDCFSTLSGLEASASRENSFSFEFIQTSGPPQRTVFFPTPALMAFKRTLLVNSAADKTVGALLQPLQTTTTTTTKKKTIGRGWGLARCASHCYVLSCISILVGHNFNYRRESLRATCRLRCTLVAAHIAPNLVLLCVCV